MNKKYCKEFFNITEKFAEAVFIIFAMFLALPGMLLGIAIAIVLDCFIRDWR